MRIITRVRNGLSDLLQSNNLSEPHATQLRRHYISFLPLGNGIYTGVFDRRNKRNILVNGDGFGIAWYVIMFWKRVTSLRLAHELSNTFILTAVN
jgi:hypothetical protein